MYKNALTTNKLARILNVSQSLVLKWLKEDKLKSIPLPSKRYKIPIPFVHDFLKEYKMPIPSELQKLIDEESSNKVKIVLIDDDQGIVDLIESAFKYSPNTEMFELFPYKSGIEALIEIDKIKPDLVLLDLEMPEIDGFEVCSKLNSKYPELKIVIVSVHLNDKNYNRISNIKYIDTIAKPFKVKDFVEKIQTIVKTNL
ncbi:MAG: response regulator [Nitrospinae bacterium]|nr:response regulator [Nitrospinota bacterium]